MLCDVSLTYSQNKLSGTVEYLVTENPIEYRSALAKEQDDKLTKSEKITRDSIEKIFQEKASVKISPSKIKTSKYLLVFDKNEIGTFFCREKELTRKLLFYQNLTKKSMISSEITISSRYLVLDTMSVIPWKLLNNTKKIQNIECFSAQAEYRGRVWTAWYAPSIPVSSGPWKLYGLPGLILEAEDRNSAIKYECATVNIPKPKEVEVGEKEFLEDLKKKRISYKEYVKTLKESLDNFEKMQTNPDGSGVKVNISNLEIFAFEEALGKRIQQKLSDTPKK